MKSENFWRISRLANWRKRITYQKKRCLQSLIIPRLNWQKVSIDFVMDLAGFGFFDAEDSIMAMLDLATKMVPLIPCKNTAMAGEVAKPYWQHVVEIHGVPYAIHSYQGARFIAGGCREIWSLLGTKLKYGTTFYSQIQDQIEKMNAIISQELYCLMSDVPDLDRWKEFFSTSGMRINSFPNRVYRCSAF